MYIHFDLYLALKSSFQPYEICIITHPLSPTGKVVGDGNGSVSLITRKMFSTVTYIHLSVWLVARDDSIHHVAARTNRFVLTETPIYAVLAEDVATLVQLFGFSNETETDRTRNTAVCVCFIRR